MKLLKWMAAAALAATLAACSGGGGCASAAACEQQTPPAAGGGGTATPTAVVSDLVVALDKSQVNNNTADTLKLTAQALDSNRNALAGLAGTVQVFDVNGGASISGGPFVTDADGKFEATVSTGTIKSNRAVTIRATVGAVGKDVGFAVTGSTIQAAVVPATPLPGNTVTVAVTLLDSANNGIAGQELVYSGVPGVNGAQTTDGQGKANIVFTAPTTPGQFTLDLAGSGVTLQKLFQVVGGGTTTIPNAEGPIVSASLSANPTVIGVNATGITTNRSQLRAVFLKAGNVPIQNVRVRYDIIPGPSGAALGGGEAISTGATNQLSDSSGIAVADYISGTRSSPNNGVWVRACYSESDFAGGACPQFVTASFTVAARPLSLTLGDNNLLAKENNNLTYVKSFVLQVSDSAGQPVPNAQISFSVDIYKYGKGAFGAAYPSDFILTNPNGSTRSVQVTPEDNRLDTKDAGRNSWCINEDANRNGNRDTVPVVEDRNLNGSLEPRQADILIFSDSATNRTDAGGTLVIKVRYPQNVATWLAYSVKATALAEGSEGTVTKRYRTNFVEGDEQNGSFLDAPYGTNPDCTEPN